MEDKIKGFERFKKSLNSFDLEYLEKKYLEEGGRGYKNMDVWLFDKWEKKNG